MTKTKAIFWRHGDCLLPKDPDSDYRGCRCDGECDCHNLPKNMKVIAIKDGDGYGTRYEAIKNGHRSSDSSNTK